MPAAVTVAIPFYGDPTMLQRCVDSITAQTYRDLHVLIVADGCDAPEFTDPRVTVYRLPENRGAYYARAVALAATDTPWHCVMDADDWVDPPWIAAMLATDKAAGSPGVVVQGKRWVHEGDRASREKLYPRAAEAPSGRMRHLSTHVGLYRTDRLRAVGGWSPAFRTGYDTLLGCLLRLDGPIGVLQRNLFHRTIHPGSLTQSPATGFGSLARKTAAATLREAYERAYAARRDTAAMRDVALSLTPARLWDEIHAHADQIRGTR